MNDIIQNTRGLLPTITRLYDYDINTIKTASIYFVISGTNLPSSESGYLYLFTLSDKNIIGDVLQFGFALSNSKLYRRYYVANRSSWMPWLSLTFS